MEELKTQGLILRASNLNDNDKIFTVFTRAEGKVTAISKGIRSHKHKDFAALQDFCYSDMVLTERTGLYYISSASVINNFFEIRNSVEQMSCAAYIADVVKNLPDELPPEEDYYSFILNTLYLMSKAQTKCADGDVVEYLLRLKAIFELKTVCSEGFMPFVDGCGGCGAVKELEYFDTSRGCVLCKNCSDKTDRENLVKVTPTVLKLLGYICKSDYKSVFGFRAGGEEVAAVCEIAEKYIINCFEMYSSALAYLKNIIFGEKNA